jgi:hypothetical protein
MRLQQLTLRYIGSTGDVQKLSLLLAMLSDFADKYIEYSIEDYGPSDKEQKHDEA